MDELHFLGPVRLGELAVLRGEVTQAWRTSVEVQVQVEAEDPLRGSRRPTTSAFLTYVALDERGQPTGVPALKLQTPAEERRAREADQRRERRLQSRRRIRRERGLEG